MEDQNQTQQQNTNQTQPPVQVPQPASAPPVDVVLTKAARLKRTFFQVLIGCLLGAASIAVVAVLIGSFNDTLARALGTIAVVAVHALMSLSYVSGAEKKDKKDGGRSIELFSNTVFGLIVASFITAIFAVWSLIGGEITYRLYLSYAVLLFATLHADVLYRIRKFDAKLDSVITANYAFMGIVVSMLFILIFSTNIDALGEGFYRVLGASGIVDATMTITAIIMHKLYLQKHPELITHSSAAESKNFWKNPLVVVLLFFLALQLVGGFVSLLFRLTY